MLQNTQHLLLFLGDCGSLILCFRWIRINIYQKPKTLGHDAF